MDGRLDVIEPARLVASEMGIHLPLLQTALGSLWIQNSADSMGLVLNMLVMWAATDSFADENLVFLLLLE